MPCLSSNKEFQALSPRRSYLKNAVKMIFLLPVKNCLQLKSLGGTKCLDIVWIGFWIFIPNVHLNLCIFECPLMSCHFGHMKPLWTGLTCWWHGETEPVSCFFFWSKWKCVPPSTESRLGNISNQLVWKRALLLCVLIPTPVTEWSSSCSGGWCSRCGVTAGRWRARTSLSGTQGTAVSAH